MCVDSTYDKKDADQLGIIMHCVVTLTKGILVDTRERWSGVMVKVDAIKTFRKSYFIFININFSRVFQ